MELSKQIKLEIPALLFSVLGIVGLFTENYVFIVTGVVACFVLLMISMFPNPIDDLVMVVFFAIIAAIGGLVLKFAAKMTFLSGAVSTLCWALLIFSVMALVAHFLAWIKLPKKTEEKPIKCEKSACKKNEPVLSNEELRDAYAKAAYESYRNAGLKIEKYRVAQQYAKRAYELGDKSMGLLLEDIESMICEIENDDY